MLSWMADKSAFNMHYGSIIPCNFEMMVKFKIFYHVHDNKMGIIYDDNQK